MFLLIKQGPVTFDQLFLNIYRKYSEIAKTLKQQGHFVNSLSPVNISVSSTTLIPVRGGGADMEFLSL